MKTKKIITWVLFVLSISLFFYIDSVSDTFYFLFPLLSSMITITLLIHYYSTNKKLIRFMKISWYILIIPFIFSLTCAVLSNMNIYPILSNPYLNIFISIYFITASLFLVVANKKVDITILILMIISLFGLYCKSQHWPGSGVLVVLGWAVPGLMFLFIIYKKINEYDSRTNSFMNFFKNFLCITLAICFIGGTFKFQHWPGAGVLMYIGLPLSIISIFVVVFLLPSSNFIEWTKEHKRMFYRALLIPLLYLSIYSSMGNIFPDIFQKVVAGRGSDEEFISNGLYFENYQIPPKEGL